MPRLTDSQSKVERTERYHDSRQFVGNELTIRDMGDGTKPQVSEEAVVDGGGLPQMLPRVFLGR